MARITLVEETTIGFEYNEELGAFYANFNPSPFVPIEEAYKVIWDGVEWPCIAFNVEGQPDHIFLGNTYALGGPNSGEPFFYSSLKNGDGATLFTFDSQPTHTIAIYQEIADEIDNEAIILKNREGVDVAYSGVDTVKFNKADGGTQTFIRGEVVEDMPIEVDFSGGNQIINAPAGILVKSAILQKPQNLIPQNIVKDVEIAGVVGAKEIPTEISTTINLDFSSGDMIIIPEEKKVFNSVEIIRPTNLLPNNIKKGEIIAGITGTLESTSSGGSGGSGEEGSERPKLNQPTVQLTSGTYDDTIKITNPTSNGLFAAGIDYYINGELVTSEAAPSQGGNITKNVMELYNDVDGEQTLGVKLTGTGFEDSEPSQVQVSMCGVTITPDGFTDNIDYPAIKGGATYEASIAHKWNNQSSEYLSPDIEVTMGGEPCTEYEWNCDANPIFEQNLAKYFRQKSGFIKVPDVNGKLEINVPYTEIPKLAKPKLVEENGKITILPSPYTQNITVYVDEQEFQKIYGINYSIDVTGKGSQSQFTHKSGVCSLQSYRQDLQAGNYSLAKLTINAPQNTQLIINAFYHSSPESNNTSNYMYFSELDTTLTNNGTLDTQNIKYSLANQSSQTEIRKVIYDIPQGEHFIYVKYIETATISSIDYSSHDFALYQLCENQNISLYDYNIHTVSAICHAGTSLDSEKTSIVCQMLPYCYVEERQLFVENILTSVEQIEIYIDGNLVNTVQASELRNSSLDLTEYPYHSTSHQVKIRALGENIDTFSSEITANLSIPSPGILMDGKTVKLSKMLNYPAQVEIYTTTNLTDKVLVGTYNYNPGTEFAQDISEGLAGLTVTKKWEVEAVSGAGYGFSQQSNGYYKSLNKGVKSSAALCKVNITNQKETIIYVVVNYTDLNVQRGTLGSYVDTEVDNTTAVFDCINYAEANYDYGILSVLDQTLSTSASADSTNVHKSFKGSSTSSIQQVTYTVPGGKHFVYVKFIKDSSTNSNNDTLQFLVSFLN